MADEVWILGRAFVYAGEGVVEYFYRFEEDIHRYRGGGEVIRSVCGGLREKHLCRPLDYVCDMKYLRNEPVFKRQYA